MLQAYRVPNVGFAPAMVLRRARHDDRGPAELVAGDIDRKTVPLEPRMGMAPPPDIFRGILIDIIRGDAQPLDKIAAEQLGGMPAGSARVGYVLQCPGFGTGCINAGSKVADSLLYF